MKSITDNLNLSLIELLSVLLPGATGLIFINKIEQFQELYIKLVSNHNDWIKGIVIFGSSYFLGYLIYVSSSFLDSIYDKIKRKALKLDSIEMKEKGLHLLPRNYKIDNWFIRFLFPFLVDTHNLIVEVVKLKNRDIGNVLDGYEHQVINAYQYSFRRLMAEQPEMFLEVERYYGTARFFRGMTMVLFLGAIIWLLYDENKILALIILLLSISSLFLFLNRWRKANHVAYKNILILEGIKKN